MEALASHQCGLGSIPGAICWFLLLLVVALLLRPYASNGAKRIDDDVALLRGFFSGFYGLPPSIKTNISKFQFDWDRGPA